MPSSAFQRDFWDGPGSRKVFTHPVRWAWLDMLSSASRVLDYGCGYGRLVAQFAARRRIGAMRCSFGEHHCVCPRLLPRATVPLLVGAKLLQAGA